MEMFRAPRKEFLPFGGGEGFMVGFAATADVAVSLDVVGKADSERLVTVLGVARVRGIVGADGGWGVDEAVEKVPNNPNGNLAETAKVPFQIIRIVKLGLATGASRRRGSRCGDARGRGQAGRRRGIRYRWGRERWSQAEILLWEGRLPHLFQVNFLEEGREVGDRDGDGGGPLQQNPPGEVELDVADNEGLP
jgi:hypothetical protein